MAPRIALHGKATSGKSTLAAALHDELGVIWTAFAAPLKHGLEIMGITKDHPLYREAAQYLATDIIRFYDANWWIKLMDRSLNQDYHRHAFGAVIDDVRFVNELEFCETNDFLTVKIEVSEDTQLARGCDPSRFFHESEVALDRIPDYRWDLVIPEATTVPERVRLVKEALSKHYHIDTPPYQLLAQ